jgi:hypothetical protein
LFRSVTLQRLVKTDIEDFVIMTVMLKVLQLIVVTTGEYPINRLPNPNPRLKPLIHVTIFIEIKHKCCKIFFLYSRTNYDTNIRMCT